MKEPPNQLEEESEKISSHRFYNEYHGHLFSDLDTAHRLLRKQGNRDGLIFLAGDSSLDNKFWFSDTADSINGYEKFLEPPKSKRDVSYWMNRELAHLKQRNEKGCDMAVLNCAIEESTIGSRARGKLLPQDIFIRDHITENDILVISLGGNDIALRPSVCTICNILSLICCTTTNCIECCANTCGGTSIPCDDPCCGLCCGCFSNGCACPPGMGYFIHMFKTRIEAILRNITSRCKPRAIAVCMIYFLDEKPGNGWADGALAALKYNSNPAKLQALIRQMFVLATKNISLPGVDIVPIPLFKALDGKNSSDYCQRVEPSGGSGGEKMANLLIETIQGHCRDSANQFYQSSEIMNRT